MRLFSWEMFANNKHINKGYVIAFDREEALEKLWYLPIANKYENEVIELTDECGYNGVEIDEVGFAISK